MVPKKQAKDLLRALKAEFGHLHLEKEKKAALVGFLKKSLDYLKKLSQDLKGRFFLGYVFEELVRSESRYGHDSQFEESLENFLFLCLQNKDEFGIMPAGFWHIPDGLIFQVHGNTIHITKLYEVKINPLQIKIGQILGHEKDSKILVEKINHRSNQNGNLPEFLKDKRLRVSSSLQKSLIFPADVKVETELKNKLENDGWGVEKSIFSLKEAAFIGRKLFPNSSAEFSFQKSNEPTETDLEKKELGYGLEEVLNQFANILSSLFAGKYHKEELREAALIWLCTDLIMLDPMTAKKTVDLKFLYVESFLEARPTELPISFQLIKQGIENFFGRSVDSEKITNFLNLFYLRFLKDKIDTMDSSLYEEVSIFNFISP